MPIFTITEAAERIMPVGLHRGWFVLCAVQPRRTGRRTEAPWGKLPVGLHRERFILPALGRAAMIDEDILYRRIGRKMSWIMLGGTEKGQQWLDCHVAFPSLPSLQK